MKIVIDTNVLMSAVFFGGQPAQVLKKWQAGAFELIVTAEILDEYKRVADRLQAQNGDLGFEPIFQLILEKAKVVKATTLLKPICRDSDDDKFLACALTAKANYVVSGDKDLLDLKSHKSVEIIKPAALNKILGKSQGAV